MSHSEVSALEAKLDRMVALLASSDRSSKEFQSNSSLSPASASLVPRDENMNMPSDQEGAKFLDTFRTKMVPLFPFVAIPAGISVSQLRQEKPFFYLNIVMVACYDAPRQREIVQTILNYVAEHIITRGEHNMDLLQGLLVHLAWYVTISRFPDVNAAGRPCETDIGTKPFRQISSQLDIILQLVMSQVTSLNLNQSMTSLRSLNRPLSYMKAVDLHPNQVPERTLEERRAYLGSYYLSVMYEDFLQFQITVAYIQTNANPSHRLSMCVRETDTPRFTKYSNECCEILKETAEYPTDSFLVQLVRVLCVGQKAHYLVSANEVDYPIALTPMLGLAIKSYQVELQQLRSSFNNERLQAGENPPCSDNHFGLNAHILVSAAVLSSHCDTIEIILYRTAMTMVTNTPSTDLPITQIDLLFRCLEAAKSFFLDFYSIDCDTLPILPFTIWCQFGTAMICLSRLILYQDDRIGWDQGYVQGTVDFHSTIDINLRRLEEAQALISYEFTEAPEIFQRLKARLKVMKDLHKTRLEGQAKTNMETSQDPLDLSFVFNLPTDAFFPYGDYGTFPLPEPPQYF